MKLQSKSIFISNFLIVVILFSTTTSITAQEVAEDEREFDYIEGSKKGTEYWGELKEERSACKDGSMQSPVDISSQTVEITPTLLEVKSSYKPGNATVKNKGHDISLQWAGNAAGSIEINGTEYFLQQCHWHSPSEHTFDGRRYDLELQMAHKSLAVKAENKIVVVGVFYNIGEPDAFPSKLMGDIMSISDQTEERNAGLINPTEIKTGGDNSYYTYMGSLTVPPCTEGVIWIIHKTLSSVSGEQVQSLREAVHDYAEMNARPVQPLHARKIHLHNA